MSPDELRAIVSSSTEVRARAFEVLREISELVRTGGPSEELARELVIRLLEHRADLADYNGPLEALVHRVGLFPYVEPNTLNESELLELEWNRPLGRAGQEYVFHAEQADIYRTLLDGANVIVSAPTSFGKSLVIDAVIATGKFTNIAIVVPTIALLDETRRRLSRFGDYKIVTHVSQAPSERNVFVMTQERLLQYDFLPRIEFFAIDEFYKLDLGMDIERAALLNQAFYRLLKDGGQFFLLGPNIEMIAPTLALRGEFVQTNFRTVALDTVMVDAVPDERTALMRLCSELREPTMIYCRSPSRARRVAEWLTEEGFLDPLSSVELRPAVEWLGETYHPDWGVANALKLGVGVHHGRLPRALAHLIVRLFNEQRLRFLVCTSTLIEGVNTTAKNVIVFDKKVGMQNYDFFTFNNIRGRVGRMFEHFVGRAYLFHAPPDEELPFVDVPVLSQGPDAPTSLLVQIDPEDLTDASRNRLAPFIDNGAVSIETLRANSGVDLDAQVTVARRLRTVGSEHARLLSWTGLPTYDQLRAACELVWVLAGPRAASGGAFSASQLTFRTWHLQLSNGDLRRLISEELENSEPDDAVETTLDFVRQWPGHHLPRLLGALERIEEEIFPIYGVRPGRYGYFASRLEQLFMPQFATALEEYGLPSQVALKIPGLLDEADTLDTVLERLAQAGRFAGLLTTFEAELLEDAVRSL